MTILSKTISKTKWIFLFPIGAIMAKPFLYGTISFYIGTAAATAIISAICQRAIKNRSELHKLEELQVLLEYISGKMGTGRTLESTLITAGAELETILGRKSELKMALTSLAYHLENQVDLQIAITQYNARFNCPRSSMIISILPWLRQSGGKIGQYLQSSHRALADELAMLKEIAAEQSQKVTEAIIMSIVPFGFAYILSQGTSLATLPNAPAWIHPAAIILFGLILLATGMTGLTLFGNSDKHSSKPDQPPKSASAKQTQLAKRALHFWHNIAPLQFDFTLAKLLAQRWPMQSDIELNYFAKKIQYLITGIALALPLVILKLSYLLFAPLIVATAIFLQDYQTWQKVELRKTSYRFDYPIWLNSLVIFLTSGLTVTKSLQLSQVAMQASSGAIKIMHHDFKLMQKSLDHGASLEKALEPLKICCPLSEINSTIELLLRFAKDGGSELLELLRLHAIQSWQQGRLARRQYLEKRSLKLLLPMGLNLMAVLFTAFLPALASLTQTF